MAPPVEPDPPCIATWKPGGRGPVRVYKRRVKGQSKQHPGSCLACMPDNVAGRDVRLKHGIVLVLCEHHRTPRAAGGHDGVAFASALSRLFHSLGLRSRRHHASLRAFVRDMCDPDRPRPPRPRPGSYAWPGRRQDAETVWSRGGSLAAGRHAALRGPPDPRTRAPTDHTVTRWWRARRWLGPPVPAR